LCEGCARETKQRTNDKRLPGHAVQCNGKLWDPVVGGMEDLAKRSQTSALWKISV